MRTVLEFETRRFSEIPHRRVTDIYHGYFLCTPTINSQTTLRNVGFCQCHQEHDRSETRSDDLLSQREASANRSLRLGPYQHHCPNR